MLAERHEGRSQHFVVMSSRAGRWRRCRPALRQIEKHVRHGARVVQRVDSGRREAHHRPCRAGFGDVVEPGLERRMVGKNQIGQAAGFVDEAAETHDVGNFRDGFADLRCRAGRKRPDWRCTASAASDSLWSGRLSAAKLSCGLLAGARAFPRGGCGMKPSSAPVVRVDQGRQRIHGERVEQAVGLGQGRSADDGGGRARSARSSWPSA